MVADRRLRDIYIVATFAMTGLLCGITVITLADNWYLPIVVMISLIAGVTTFIEPIWGLYLFVVAMFTEGLLATQAGPTGARLVGVLVLGAWIARSLSNRHFRVTLPLPGFFAIAYVVWGLMSVLWAIDARLAFERAQTLVQSVAFYVLVVNLVDSQRRLQKILFIVIVVSLILAFLIIFQVLSGEMAEGRIDIAQVSDYDPNEQAASFLLGAALLMALLSQQEIQVSMRLLSLIALSVVVVAILATGSRGAVVALVATLAFTLVFDRKSWQLVALTLLVGGAALFFLPPTFLERLKSIVTLSDRGAGRVDIWLVGLQIVGAHLLVGVGWGNYGKAFDIYLSQTPGIRSFLLPRMGPHNIFLGALGELGVIGLALFVIMIGLSIKSVLVAVLNFKRRNDLRMIALATGTLLSLLGVLVAGLFVDLRYRKYFWLLLALSGVMSRLSPESKEGI